MSQDQEKAALDYHAMHPAGKVAIQATKRMATQGDLSLAYSPGVAIPCEKIRENKDDVYKYTSKGNLVAVITNGTAVLGLGDIGPEASKPVMEGKGVLFKRFAGIDVFDIEIDEKDPQAFVRIVKSLEPSFGGINLEDIKAPESFEIEEALKEQLSIPVMHDDQHGTAIISAAALINALEILGKKLKDLQLVVNGAGAAALACISLYIELGVSKQNIVVLDSRGVIRQDREGLQGLKQNYATSKDVHTLEEAIKGADMFLGLSQGNLLSPDMLLSMAGDPIVFALANPEPEIRYELALETRSDVIMATGRSDHPNQVNNVLGFPYIFRGALDVRARCISEEMKRAAVHALAALGKEPVPDSVAEAYGVRQLSFGRTYLIPKPFDPRLITAVSPAVARAAIKSGVARTDIYDWSKYEKELRSRVGLDPGFLDQVISRAAKAPCRVAYGDAERKEVLRAAHRVAVEGVAKPVLVGNRRRILELLHEMNLSAEKLEVMDPLLEEERREGMAKHLFERRQRQGMTLHRARSLVKNPDYFGILLTELEEVEVYISGSLNDYRQLLRLAIEGVGTEEGIRHVAGLYVLVGPKGTYFLADTSVNVDPNAEALVDIVSLSTRFVRAHDFIPHVAMLSYSNFGASSGDVSAKIHEALALIHERHPDLVIDGELQANVALSPAILQEVYAFSHLNGKPVNTLIFPSLVSANIAYKLLVKLGGFEGVGPILMGLDRSIQLLYQGASEREIFNFTAFAVVDAQHRLAAST